MNTKNQEPKGATAIEILRMLSKKQLQIEQDVRVIKDMLQTLIFKEKRDYFYFNTDFLKEVETPDPSLGEFINE